MPKYKDFKIVISRNGTDKYSVEVRETDQIGGAVSTFEKKDIASFDDSFIDDSEKLKRKMEIISDEPKDDFDYSEAFDSNAAKAFGQKLTDVIFSRRISERLGDFKRYCRDNDAILRIRLDLTDVPELAALPWEYLCRTEDNEFVCLDNKITLVRGLRTAYPASLLKVSSDLRILIMSSAPKDAVRLNDNAEIKQIENALREVNDISVNKIYVEVLQKATSKLLKERLTEARQDNKPFHILHFIGHGEFLDNEKQGVLLFENEDGTSSSYDNSAFARLLKNFNSDLRLVVLNSCQGATLSATDSYSSVATKIMQTAEIPAVVAMQFSITDNAAIAFAKSFYTELAKGENLEQAVYQARLDVKVESEKEWATPVLYLRSEDGHLFDVKIPKVDDNLAGHYSVLKSELKDCKCVIFLGLDVNLLNRTLREPWRTNYGFPSTVELCSFLNSKLTPNPQNKSLAGIATQLDISNTTNLGDDFATLFYNAPANLSKLYETLAGITKNITDNLPDEAKDSSRSGLLFVTTTFDSNLENAFKQVGITDFHVVYYDEDDNRQPRFSHTRYKEGEPEKDEDGNSVKIPITKKLAQTSEGFKDKYPVILKLQGQSQPKSSLVIREDDFFIFTNKEPIQIIPALLKTQIEENRHLYLGYNLQDWSLRMLWNWLCKGRTPQVRKNSWAIIGKNDLNKIFWDKCGVTCQLVDFDDYVKGLEEKVWDKPKEENQNG